MHPIASFKIMRHKSQWDSRDFVKAVLTRGEAASRNDLSTVLKFFKFMVTLKPRDTAETDFRRYLHRSLFLVLIFYAINRGASDDTGSPFF
jgi:hypothetical protein